MKALRVVTASFEDGDEAVVGAEGVRLAKGGGVSNPISPTGS